MESEKNTKNTAVKKWAATATEEQWVALEQDIEEHKGTQKGYKQFADKYGFSIPGVKPYLEKRIFEKMLREEYERRLQEALAAHKESSGQFIYQKPSTPYKKVSLTLTVEAYNKLTQTVTALAEQYGYEKRYVTSKIILDACKRFG